MVLSPLAILAGGRDHARRDRPAAVHDVDGNQATERSAGRCFALARYDTSPPGQTGLDEKKG